jgi:hypothetical protein
MRFTIRCAALAMSALLFAAVARAETINCTEITSVPYFVSAPGIYCLKSSLNFASGSGTGIEIQSDDVVLDLNGHVLDNSAAGAGSSSWGVTRTGGSTFALSPTGIYAGGAGAHIVDNEVVDTMESAGGLARGIGLDSAPGAAVERNMISNASVGPTSSYGVYVLSSSSRSALVGNRIANMRTGISFNSGTIGVYMDNTVGGATTPFSGGTAAGATNFSF